MNPKKTTRRPTEGERALWLRTMASVKPKPKRTHATADVMETKGKHSKAAKRLNGVASPQAATEAGLTPNALPPLEIGKTGGTDRRTADRLRRGKLAIDMRLDLHGLTLDLAHRRLLGFLHAAQASGAKCVLVITGKGSPTGSGQGRLRGAVPRWLNEPAFRPMVLSVAQARQRDGGDGALYILIRRSRKDRP